MEPLEFPKHGAQTKRLPHLRSNPPDHSMVRINDAGKLLEFHQRCLLAILVRLQHYATVRGVGLRGGDGGGVV